MRLAVGGDVQTAFRAVIVSDANDDNWQRRFLAGWHFRSYLSCRGLNKENDEPLERHWSGRQLRMLKEIVAKLDLNKPILEKARSTGNLEQKPVNLKHLKLLEILDFNTLDDRSCFRLNGFRSRPDD